VRTFRDKAAFWQNLKLHALALNIRSNPQASDKIQVAQQLITNKEKELELNKVKSAQNSLNVVKDTLLNSEVFNKVFVDENLFSELGPEEFFKRLNSAFKWNEASREPSARRADLDSTLNKVTENQEIKQLINQQLEKTKVLKVKLDEVKDELFSD